MNTLASWVTSIHPAFIVVAQLGLLAAFYGIVCWLTGSIRDRQ